MQINALRVYRSLYWDLGFRSNPIPKYQDRVDRILQLQPDAIQSEGAAVMDEIRTEGHDISGSDAYRLFQLFGVLHKTPGSLNRDKVLQRLIDKQDKIGHVLLDNPDIAMLRRIIRHWLSDSPFGEFEDECRHGPGATADRALWDDKWHALRHRPLSLEPLFRRVDPLSRLSRVSPRDDASRVIVVEKNYKGGRVIAAEQASRQFVQQGLGRVMINRLERRARIFVRDASLHIDFLKDNLADAVTVDLSEASDYVSAGLVAALFPPEWVKAIFASRSSKLSVDGTVFSTKTVASMGNGFCFSVLTTVCGALCALATGHWKSGKLWSVFGDDIIVTNRHYPRLRNMLCRAGLVINYDKTFTPDNPFAETCGVDLWRSDRTNVRPRYLRSHLTISDTKDLIKVADFQRFAGACGFSQTASYLVRFCDPRFRSSLTIPIPGWSLLPSGPGIEHPLLRWNARYHRLEAYGFVGHDPKRPSALDAGESWAKATFGCDCPSETLTRSGHFKLKWLPVN